MLLEASVALGLIAACAILMRWRLGIVALFLLVVLEGAIRKWALPSLQEYVYFAKDAVLLLTWFSFLMDRSAPRRQLKLPGGYFMLLAAYAFWVAAEVANPRLPSLALGLFGAKTHLLYFLLIWMMPSVFSNLDQAMRWLRWYAYLSLPVIALAMIQVNAKTDSPLNMYVGTATQTLGTAIFGERGFVRATGTFPYISGFVAFIFFASALSFGLLAGRRWRLSGSRMVLFSLVGCWGGFFLSGSRGPVWIWLSLFPILILLLVQRRMINLRLAALMVAGLGIAAAVMALGFEGIYDGFIQRVQAGLDSGESDRRVWQAFTVPFQVWPEAGISGYGAGATHPAASALVPDLAGSSWLPVIVEGELERIAIELGVVGQVLAIAARLAVCIYAWNLLKYSRRDDIFGLALFLFIVFAANVIGHLVFNATAGILYWGSVGMLFWLWELQTHEVAFAELSRSGLSSRPAVLRPVGRLAS